MQYRVYGGFKVPLDPNGCVDYKKAAKAKFWNEVEKKKEGLLDGHGCYLFAMSTSAITPWCVGKAEYQSFKQEIFTHHKLIYYNEVLLEYERGEPLIYLIPRFSPKGRLGKPGKNNSVQFLETLLIGMALRRNDDIKNIKGTALLKTLQVHGVINSDRKGHPGDPAVQLKAALGIGA